MINHIVFAFEIPVKSPPGNMGLVTNIDHENFLVRFDG